MNFSYIDDFSNIIKENQWIIQNPGNICNGNPTIVDFDKINQYRCEKYGELTTCDTFHTFSSQMLDILKQKKFKIMELSEEGHYISFQLSEQLLEYIVKCQTLGFEEEWESEPESNYESEPDSDEEE